MPIFLSMIVWVVLMRILCSGSMRYTRIPGGGRAYKVPTMVSILTMGYIVFWIGMSSFMADSTAYIINFHRISSDISHLPGIMTTGGKETLWSASIVLFKAFISDNHQVWLMSLSILMGGAVAHCYRKHSEAFFFSMLIFILACDFSWMYNGIRQFSCVALLMLAFPLLIKGEIKKYIALIAILSLVHFSVWVMVPICYVVRQKPWGKMVVLSIFAVVLVCAFITPFVSMVETSLEQTAYSGVSLISEDDDGAHPVRVIILAIPAILAWFCRNQKEVSNNAIFNICTNFSVIAALLMLIAVFTSGIVMGRLAIYCSIYSAILLPMAINRWPVRNQRVLLIFVALVCYAYYFYITIGGQYYYSILTGWIA